MSETNNKQKEYEKEGYADIKFIKSANIWIARRTFNVKGKTDKTIICNTEEEAQAALAKL